MALPDLVGEGCWALYDKACVQFRAKEYPEASDTCRAILEQPYAPYLAVSSAYYLLYMLPGSYPFKRYCLERGLEVCQRMKEIKFTDVVKEELEAMTKALEKLDAQEMDRKRLLLERDEEMLDAVASNQASKLEQQRASMLLSPQSMDEPVIQSFSRDTA